MAQITGKSVTFKAGDGGTPTEVFTTVAAATSHSVSINNTLVEFNTKDSGGFRDLFPAGSIRSMTISASFQFTNTADQDRLLNVVMSTTDTSLNGKYLLGSGEEFFGNWQIASMEYTGETEGFATFDVTLESNGIILLQAAS